MPKTGRLAYILKNTALLSWSALTLSIFIFFSGQHSFLYGTDLSDFPQLLEKLEQISVASYLGDLIFALFGVSIFSLSYISLGLFLSKWLGLNQLPIESSPLTKLANLATWFLLGGGTLSLVFLTIAEFLKLTFPVVAIVLTIGIISGLTQWKSAFEGIFSRDGLKNVSEQTIFWLSSATLILALFLSSARISYDASAIYFSNAKITALTNHTRFFVDVFVASAFHAGIQYTALIQLFGDQSARLLAWIYGLAIIIICLALGEKVNLPKTARPILLALLVTSSAFIELMGDGKIDLMSSAPAIAAVYWMVNESYALTGKKRVLLLIGFLAGLASIGRPYNVFLLGIFILLFYFQRIFLNEGFQSSSLKTFTDTLLWIFGGAVGPGLYHLFTYWILLGSPLAFLSSISGINATSGPWDADPNQLMMLRLLYPLTVSFRNTPQSLGNITPLVLAFLPFWFVKEIRKKVEISQELARLTIIAITVIYIWILTFFTIVEIRYVFFLWAIIYIPIAELISIALKNEYIIFRNWHFGLLAALLAFFVFRTAFIAIDSYSPLDKNSNPQCTGYIMCDYLKTINHSASPGDRVLTLSAYRYYLRTDLFACSTGYFEYQTLHDLSHLEPEKFWEEVYREGYTYIAFEKEYTTRHLQLGFLPSADNTPAWMRLERLDNSGVKALVAYRIHVNNPPNQPEKYCKQDENGIWQVMSLHP